MVDAVCAGRYKPAPSAPSGALVGELANLYERISKDGTTQQPMAFWTQVILPTASGVSNEGGRSPLLVPLPAVSWPWVPAWGSLEPPRRDGENAQKTRNNGGKMGEIWSKTCEQGRDRKDQLGTGVNRCPACRSHTLMNAVW